MIKKCLLFVLCLFLTQGLLGQNNQDNQQGQLSPQDSTFLSKQSEELRQTIMGICKQLYITGPRYKLYKTQNTYNLIRLDTATGAVWQVQYRMETTQPMILEIDETSLISVFDKVIPGRFELYETNNMYTFILIDTQTGEVWQVQWNTEGPNKRFRERIYE